MKKFIYGFQFGIALSLGFYFTHFTPPNITPAMLTDRLAMHIDGNYNFIETERVPIPAHKPERGYTKDQRLAMNNLIKEVLK